MREKKPSCYTSAVDSRMPPSAVLGRSEPKWFPRGRRWPSRSAWGTSALLSLFAVTASGACSIYDTSLLRPGDGGLDAGGVGGAHNGTGATSSTGAVSSTAGSGTGGTGGTPPVDICPDRALTQAQGTDSSFSFGTSSIDFGTALPDTTGYRNIGIDLDGDCDRVAAEPECSDADFSDGTYPDGALGVDNAGGGFFRYFQDQLFSLPFNENITVGNGAILFHVSGYNDDSSDEVVGDDNDVDVALLIAAPYPDGITPSMDNIPSWDIDDTSVQIPSGAGCDPAAPSACRQFSATTPTSLTDIAYISGGRLVARFPDMRIVLPGQPYASGKGDIEIILKNSTLLCDIQATPDNAVIGNAWRANECTLGGRWQLSSALLAAQRMADPLSGTDIGSQPMCLGDTGYSALQGLLCRSVDRARTREFPSSDVACDGLSFGMNMTMVSAIPNYVVPVDRSPNLCDGSLRQAPACL